MPTAVVFDRTRISDPALQPIADRVMAGERLTAADGIALFRTPDLMGSVRWPTRRIARSTAIA